MTLQHLQESQVLQDGGDAISCMTIIGIVEISIVDIVFVDIMVRYDQHHLSPFSMPQDIPQILLSSLVITPALCLTFCYGHNILHAYYAHSNTS